MIVACPRCHKQYRLDASRLHYTRLPDNSELGVQLACSNCHEQWWEIKKESVNTNKAGYRDVMLEQPFRNLTDLSLLYQQRSANYAYQNTTAALDFPLGTNIAPKVEDKMFSAALPIKNQTTKRKLLVRIALWSFIIFGGAVAFLFTAMKFTSILSWISDTNTHSTLPVPGEIRIGEDIKFDVKPVDSTQQRVIVEGTVKNPGPFAVPLHDIQIAAWGSCTEGQTPNDQGLCQIRVWPYKWKQDLLQTGEQLPFKSAAKIPANLQVDQVHVNVAAN